MSEEDEVEKRRPPCICSGFFFKVDTAIHTLGINMQEPCSLRLTSQITAYCAWHLVPFSDTCWMDMAHLTAAGTKLPQVPKSCCYRGNQALAGDVAEVGTKQGSLKKTPAPKWPVNKKNGDTVTRESYSLAQNNLYLKENVLSCNLVRECGQ